MDIGELIKSRKEKGEKIKIELGCGPSKMDGYIGIDFMNLPGVDFVADIEKGLPFLEDNSIDEISSRHVFEHLENFGTLIKEIHRVLKSDGIHSITVPHFSNPYYYSDYTHKRFFGLYTFDYFATKETMLKRKVPSFYSDFKFEIISRRLKFKSTKMLRYLLFKKPCNILFNMNNFTLELYEELFTGIFSCFEIQFIMRPFKPVK